MKRKTRFRPNKKLKKRAKRFKSVHSNFVSALSRNFEIPDDAREFLNLVLNTIQQQPNTRNLLTIHNMFPSQCYEVVPRLFNLLKH